jgi:hypothetical protein
VKCYFHPEIEAAGVCVNCGKFLCRDCQTVYNQKSHCSNCFEEVLSGGRKSPLNISVQKPDKNWFQRHLNWTLILGGIGIFFVDVLIGIFLRITGLFRLLTVFRLDFVLGVILFMLFLVHIGWFLRRKNRSLAWVLIIFVPFGWIVLLALANKSEGYINPEEIDGMAQHEKIQDEIKQFREKYPGRY